MDKINGCDLMVKIFKNNKGNGIFATKSSKQLNSVGLLIIRLLGIENNVIDTEMVDLLHRTPLIDIKLFFSKFDNRTNTKFVWLDNQRNTTIRELRSDEHFKL